MITQFTTRENYFQGTNAERTVAWPSVTIADNGLTFYETDTNDLYRVLDGEWVSLTGGLSANQTTMLGAFNGQFLETFNALVTSDGATITMSLEQSGGGDLTMNFSDGFTTLDCTPAATIALTAGSATSPQENYIYIPQSTKVLTKSTSDWPAGEHIKVGKFVVQDAGTVQTDGALMNQNWNDHATGTDSQGHILHIAKRLRYGGAKYYSGLTQTITINTNVGTPDNVWFSCTAGVVFQLHEQTFSAFDMQTGDKINVPNDSVTPYTSTTDLADLLTDSAGVSMSGKHFNLVIWGIINKSGETQHVMVNLPSGSYTKASDATGDVSGYDNYSIPAAFRTVAFLIMRVTLHHSVASGGTWTSVEEKDLRGVDPFVTAGGGTSTNQTEFADNTFRIFDDADPTKELAFQASGITTGTTRTLTVPDENGTIFTNQGGTMVGQLFIDGSADEIQLRVQGNAAQTTNIFEVETSVATNIFTVSTTALQMGLAAGHNIVINSSGITGDFNGTEIFVFNPATYHTIGNSSNEHIRISDDGTGYIKFHDGANEMWGFDQYGTLTCQGLNDNIHLRIIGNVTQTSYHLSIVDSALNDLFYVDQNGYLVVVNPSDAPLTTYVQITPTNSDTSASYYGLDLKLIQSAASANGIYGARGKVYTTHSVGTMSAIYGLYGIAQNVGTGTSVVTTSVSVAASGIVGASATTTNHYGFYCVTPTNTGTLTNAFGLYVLEQNSAASVAYGAYVNDRVFIDGSQDQPQLIIQANATQTGATLIVETSSGTDKVSLWNTGVITLAPDNNVGTLVSGSQVVTGTASVTYSLIGGTFAASSTSGSSALAGMTPIMLAANASGTFSAVYGVANAIYGRTSGAGTVTNVYGVRYQPYASGGGTITNLFGVYIDSPVGSGITNHYGIYIEPVASGSNFNRAIFVQSGISEFSDQVFIDGSSDTTQLLVQANGTQTQNIFVVENSSGTNLVYVDKEGRFLVGGNVGTQTLTLSHHKWTAALTTGSSYFALQAQLYDTSANSASNTAIRGNAYSGHTSGTIGNTVGVASIAYAAGSGGTTTNLFGFRTDSDVTSGATVSVRAGMYIANATGSGTLTTQYGIYLTSMNKGATNYAMYTGTGLVYVQDQLTVAGTQDIVQTRIFANGTQTQAILVVYDSTATAGLVVYNDKTEIYGGGASTYHKLGVKWTDVASASGSYYCMDMAIYNTTAGSAALIGARGIVFANSTGALTGSHTGFIGSVYQNAAGGSVSGAYGVRAQIVANNATGTISNAYGFQCDSFTATGTITNAYGYYCGSMTSGATLNYVWFSGQGLAEFNDQIYIDGSQDIIQLKVEANGTQTNDLVYFANSGSTQLWALGGSGGVEVGVPTGGNKGNGTINTAGDIYKNNTAYTNPDYALEWWATGRITRFISNEGAKGYTRLSLEELKEYIQKNYSLPRRKKGPMGAFERADWLLEKVEEMATYILELHERIAALEAKQV